MSRALEVYFYYCLLVHLLENPADDCTVGGSLHSEFKVKES